ncbi:MAG: protoporphyrinogen oxidase [Actinomycetota bacterium]
MSDRVVVVGGGVAGLATAHALLRETPGFDVVVLEADQRPGGRLRTVRVGDLDLDAGPDSFVARKPWAVDLCASLGLELEDPGASGAFVWTERGLVPMPSSALGVPADLDELARWPAMSRRGRLRALSDLVRRARPREDDEALGALLRRRLGDEATNVLVAPLLAGLFAGEVDRLGVRATFPELAAWERDFGSLIRGAKASLRSARGAGPIFRRPLGGPERLVAGLTDAIGPERVHASARASSVDPGPGGLVVRGARGETAAAAVVLATPAFAAADLLAGAAPRSSAALAAIPYVSTAVVLLVYPAGTGDGLPASTGFVVPSGRAPMTAATFLSRKWPAPAYGNRAVLRCFVGAAGSEDVLDASDEDVVGAVCRHLAAVLPLPERPEASAVVRWPRSMPQYGVGHRELVSAIEDVLPPGIFVTGNAYRGVGVADTVRGAMETAGRVRAHLAGTAIGTERVP